MEILSIEKTYTDNSVLNKIINTDFTFFKKPPIEENEITTDDFFEFYESLFYGIDKEGLVNSHKYILSKTLDYLGLSLKDDNITEELINEITRLKSELLEINKININ